MKKDILTVLTLNFIANLYYSLIFYMLPILLLVSINEGSVSTINGISSLSIKSRSDILYALTENDL